MSRIGNRKIAIPEGVTITEENGIVTVKGPKGSLTTNLVKGITIKVEDNTLEVLRANDNYKPMHGTINANINNMITGVTHGYEKKLEIIGVGYRFTLKGNVIVISAGYSHPVEMQIPEGITVEVPSNTELLLKVSIKKKLENLQQMLEKLDNQNLIKEKVFVIKTNTLFVRKVRKLLKI